MGRQTSMDGYGEHIVTIMEDSAGNKFGCLTTSGWKLNDSNGFGGTGESFVFSFWPDGFRVGTSTQCNSFFQAMQMDGITIGGGGQGAHLTLCKDLKDGTSAGSATYNTGAIAPSRFQVFKMEAWGFISRRFTSSFLQGKMDYDFLFKKSNVI